MERNFIFPEGFLWGSATSAFQVEGGCKSHDFYDWALKGGIKDGTNPADAVYFWQKYKKDISLMKKMHHSTARIGVEWARIEPREGRYSPDALEVYTDIVNEMRKEDIIPMVTLHHFALPIWLAKKGGWTNREAVYHFKKFAELVVRYLGDKVKLWITINEPAVYSFAAYFIGEFPPDKKSMRKAFKALKNLTAAHIGAYDAIHEIFRQKLWGKPVVGIAKHLRPFDPFNNRSLLDRFSAWLHDRYFNNYFLERINRKKVTLDMLGINYYSGDLIKFPFKRIGRDSLPKNKLGWDIYPEGFYRVLKRYWNLYQLPIYVTENGTCDELDELRPRFILDHIYQMFNAVSEGVDIAAYYHWSTLDNFELVDGLMSRFGLVHVDHESPDRKRKIKRSGRMFGKIALENGITEKVVKKYIPYWNPGQ